MEDYKIRFKSEYYELFQKANKLMKIVEGMKNGALDFTPTCSYELLNAQLMAMSTYLAILRERARLEKIDLEELKKKVQ